VLQETTSRGLCELVCPSRTSEQSHKQTPGWLVQDPTTSPSGDLIPTIRGSGTREEPGTLTQGGALFSLVPLVWESNPKLQGGWCKPLEPTQGGAKSSLIQRFENIASPNPRHVVVCVYDCRTYYKAVCGGGGGQ
jgi:hypothetical protein